MRLGFQCEAPWCLKWHAKADEAGKCEQAHELAKRGVTDATHLSGIPMVKVSNGRTDGWVHMAQWERIDAFQKDADPKKKSPVMQVNMLTGVLGASTAWMRIIVVDATALIKPDNPWQPLERVSLLHVCMLLGLDGAMGLTLREEMLTVFGLLPVTDVTPIAVRRALEFVRD